MSSPKRSVTAPARFSLSLAEKGLTESLLILATALMVYWQPFTRQTPLKPSDVLFLAGLAAWGRYVLYTKRVPSLPAGLTPSLLVLFGSILAATIIGYSRYALPMSWTGAILLDRLAVDMLLFFAVYTLLQADGAFCKKMCLAFLSPIVLFALLLVPNVAAMMWEGGGEPRFQGLTQNANTASKAFVIGFAFAYALAIHEMVSRRRIRGVAYALVSAGMVVLILWSHSRAYLVSTFVCAVLAAAMNASHLTLPRFKVVAVTALAYIIIATVILVLAPRSLSTLWARIGPSQVGVLEKLREDPHIVAAGYYSRLLPTHPFGLGVNFETRFLVHVPSTGELAGTNTILDIPVYGGIGAIVSLGYLGFRVVSTMRRKLVVGDEPHLHYAIGAVAALSGLWIAAIPLGSPIFDYQFWILLAIALQ